MNCFSMGHCRKIRFRNKGNNTHVSYYKPVNKNDFKRHGKFMVIESKGFTVRLNGSQINTIKKALRDVGEIGGRVNKKKCQIW